MKSKPQPQWQRPQSIQSGTNSDFHGKWLLKNTGLLPKNPVTCILPSRADLLKKPPKETKAD